MPTPRKPRAPKAKPIPLRAITTKAAKAPRRKAPPPPPKTLTAAQVVTIAEAIKALELPNPYHGRVKNHLSLALQALADPQGEAATILYNTWNKLCGTPAPHTVFLADLEHVIRAQQPYEPHAPRGPRLDKAPIQPEDEDDEDAGDDMPAHAMEGYHIPGDDDEDD